MTDLDDLLAAEPWCCRTPMVHNSGTGQYECADAFFVLIDDGLITDDNQLRTELDRMTTYQRERYEHWLTARVPDSTERADR